MEQHGDTISDAELVWHAVEKFDSERDSIRDRHGICFGDDEQLCNTK